MTDKYEEKSVDLFNQVIAKAAVSVSFDDNGNMLCKLNVKNEHCLPIANALRAANDEKCEKCKQEKSVIAFPSEDEVGLHLVGCMEYTLGVQDCYSWLRSKVEGK